MILSWLSLYGEVLSDVVEDVFEDSEDSEGTNATGIYSVKMKLTTDIPQLLPMDGRRIKIYYRGISKLCTSCFGKHVRRDCKNEKAQWIDYVRNFVNKNPQISKNQYGKWISILERDVRQIQEKAKQTHSIEQASSNEFLQERNEDTSSVIQQNVETNDEETNNSILQDLANLEATPAIQSTQTTSQDGDQQSQVNVSQPTMAEFNVPETDEEMTKLINTMLGCGMTRKDVETNIEKRKKLYAAAVRDFNKPQMKKGRPLGSRKNSK